MFSEPEGLDELLLLLPPFLIGENCFSSSYSSSPPTQVDDDMFASSNRTLMRSRFIVWVVIALKTKEKRKKASSRLEGSKAVPAYSIECGDKIPQNVAASRPRERRRQFSGFWQYESQDATGGGGGS
jgi:hypothetical protein